MFARLPSRIALGAAALSAAGLMLVPATASAQAYGYDQPYYDGYSQQRDYRYDDRGQSYDYCRGDRRNRTGTGVAVGATLGAVLGSQLGARGRRTEGSALGAVIGGALGAAVGHDSARNNCDNGYSGHVQYDDRRYKQPRYSYDDRGYSSQRYGYDDRYDDRDYRYQQSDRYAQDCRPVAIQSRDRYGRLVTRYQPSC